VRRSGRVGIQEWRNASSAEARQRGHKDLYGKEIPNKQILSGTVKTPALAAPFLAAIRTF
jgi:lipid-binding SYLF domain-containing protein